MILLGDCLLQLKTLDPNSVDSVVTDPPYGLLFMGKKWDYDVPKVEIWREVLRVLKPGGHMLAACGTRTQHRMAINIEDAGFEIRDVITWHYGSGFPKSMDISKAIDKAAGAEREVIGKKEAPGGFNRGVLANSNFGRAHQDDNGNITAPATPDAKKWAGFGTALKPATEFWTLARKPIEGTVAANVLKHGAGGLNIDATRISFANERDKNQFNADSNGINRQKTTKAMFDNSAILGRHDLHDSRQQGRFPANVIFDEYTAGLLDEQVSKTMKMHGAGNKKVGKGDNIGDKSMFGLGYNQPSQTYDGSGEDSSLASRFFYCAKASRGERNAGLEGMPKKLSNVGDERPSGSMNQRIHGKENRESHATANHHPTVKPIRLMQYLITLITPPGGTVLDPFMGSGSTGVAAKKLGFKFVGVELSKEYFEIAERRLAFYETDIFS